MSKLKMVIFMVVMSCLFASFAYAGPAIENVDFSLSHRTQVGQTYYGLFSNPNQWTDGLVGNVVWHVNDAVGSLGYEGTVDYALNYQNKNNGYWTGSNRIYWNKTWENIFLSEFGWKQNSNVSFTANNLQGVYAKIGLNMPDVYFHPYAMFYRDYDSLKFNRYEIGIEDTYPVASLMNMQDNYFALYLKAAIGYMDADNSSKLVDINSNGLTTGKPFKGWHDYTISVGVPVYLNKVFAFDGGELELKPAVTFVGSLNDSARRLDEMTSYNSSTSNVVIGNLALTYRF